MLLVQAQTSTVAYRPHCPDPSLWTMSMAEATTATQEQTLLRDWEETAAVPQMKVLAFKG